MIEMTFPMISERETGPNVRLSVTDEVARVEVVNSAGRADRVAITADRGFAYVVPPGELKRGIGPVAVVAFDSEGQVLDRQATGIG